MRNRPTGFYVDVGLKALLVGVQAFGALSGGQQFDGKGFGFRLALAIPVVIVVPALWAAFGKHPPYPYAADALLTLPWLVDAFGNLFDMYDRYGWWDDANHYFNWMLLCAGVGMLLLRVALPPVVIAALTVGFGTFAAIVWELGEYMAFIRHSSELTTAYTDTLGDLMLGTLGSITAAVAVGVVARRRVTRT